MKFLAFQFVPIASQHHCVPLNSICLCLRYTCPLVTHTRIGLPWACSPDETVPALAVLLLGQALPLLNISTSLHWTNSSVSMSVLYWEAQSGHSTPVLRRQVIVLLLRPRMLLATFALKKHCGFMVSLVSTWTSLILLHFQLSSIISSANIPEIKAQNPDRNLWIYVISQQVWLTLFVTAEGERLYLLHSSHEVSELKVRCWHPKRCWKIRKP